MEDIALKPGSLNRQFDICKFRNEHPYGLADASMTILISDSVTGLERNPLPRNGNRRLLNENLAVGVAVSVRFVQSSFFNKERIE